MTLFGRHRERALVAERLGDPACHWLTLTGPGGMGKTTLALAVSQDLAPGFRHPPLWLSGREGGAALRDAEAVLRQVTGHCQGDTEDARALLLVLDNLETVPAEATRALLRELPARLPGIVVLATSRRRLGDGREWLFELGGLSLEREDPLRPATSAAARLLLAAAQQASAPPIDDDGRLAAERIAARLGGLPLALLQAGRSAQRLGIKALLAQLEDDAARSLAAVFDESWAQLPAPARGAALRLAALPADADLELAGIAGVSADDIATLRDHSWLSIGEAGRYTMHPLQQDHLRRRADCSNLVAGLPATLARALAARLPQVPPFGDGPLPDAEQRQALQQLAASPLGSSAVIAAAAAERLASAELPALQAWVDGAVTMLVLCDRAAEATALLDAAARRPDLPHWLAAGWRLRRAELHVALGYGPGTFEAFLLPLAQLGLGGIRPDIVPTAPSLPRAWLHAWWGRGWPGDAGQRAALARLVQRCLLLLGQLLSFAPQPRGMARATLLAMAIARPAGGGAARQRCWTMVGYGALFDGWPGLARATLGWCDRGRPLPRNPGMQVHSEFGAVVSRLALGHWQGLQMRLQAVADECRRQGNRRGEFEARSVLGKFAFYRGHVAEAERLFAEVDARARQQLGHAWQAWGAIGLAECRCILRPRDGDGLKSLLDRASAQLTEVENIDNAYTLRRLGLASRLAWLQGDAATARDALAAATASMAQVRQRGFWAHEGYAGIGEGLLAWLAHERHIGGPQAPAREAWRTFWRSLQGHVGRFPPGLALLHRLHGLSALADGDSRRSRSCLLQGLHAAERQGLRVELLRCCEALASLEPQAGYGQRAQALWQDIAQCSQGAAEAGFA